MEGIDQPVNGGKCILLGGIGQMSVARRGGRAAVTEERLDMTQA